MEVERDHILESCNDPESRAGPLGVAQEFGGLYPAVDVSLTYLDILGT